jgi:hypothetical protein
MEVRRSITLALRFTEKRQNRALVKSGATFCKSVFGKAGSGCHRKFSLCLGSSGKVLKAAMKKKLVGGKAEYVLEFDIVTT